MPIEVVQMEKLCLAGKTAVDNDIHSGNGNFLQSRLVTLKKKMFTEKSQAFLNFTHTYSDFLSCPKENVNWTKTGSQHLSFPFVTSSLQ